MRLRDGRFELLAVGAGRTAAEHFRTWYRRHATDVLNARVAHFAPLVGVAPPPIAIKDMRSRWGSCSAKGRVSLHWGLVLLEPALLDYVVVHELAHLLELNHQLAFWRGVERLLPDYRSVASACARRARGASSSARPCRAARAKVEGSALPAAPSVGNRHSPIDILWLLVPKLRICLACGGYSRSSATSSSCLQSRIRSGGRCTGKRGSRPLSGANQRINLTRPTATVVSSDRSPRRLRAGR